MNTLMALRARDGSPLWSVQAPYDYLPAPKVDLALVGQVLYLVGGEHMSLFNVQDGKMLSAYTSRFSLRIILPGDHLYGSMQAKGESFCALKSSDSTKLWCSDMGGSLVVVGRENVYLFNQ